MSPIQMSKVESAMRTVLAFKEAFNRHDVPGMVQLISQDCIFEDHAPAPDGSVYSGRQAVTRFWEGFFSQAADVRMTVEDIFGYGERCILRWKLEWGENHLRGVDIFQVKDDLICERFSYAKGDMKPTEGAA